MAIRRSFADMSKFTTPVLL